MSVLHAILRQSRLYNTHWVKFLCILALVGTFLPLLPVSLHALATSYSCDETGLNNALAAGGDATFSCTAPTTVVVSATKTVALSVNLDGGNLLTISGGGFRRDFSVNAGVTLGLANLTVTDGKVINNSGGNISNAGTLNLTNVTISNGHASVTFAGTTGGNGGGIYNTKTGTLNISKSTFYGNVATMNVSGTGGIGGAIENSGTLNITNSTFSGNSANTGGAIATYAGPTTIVNSTLASNSADSDGGNIYVTGSMTIKNTLIANGTITGSPNNCSSTTTFTSQGHNLSSDTTCSASLNQTGDLNNTAANLGPLANNGGPTQTHLPQSGSPAINGGDNNGCPADDQRGIPRPQGGVCDIGAVEVAFPPSSLSSLNPGQRYAGTAGFSLVIYGSNFMPGAVVLWNGSTRSTTYNNSNQLTVSIPASDLANTGTATITVQNPGGVSSTNSLAFAITEGPDTISDCSEYGLDAALYNGGNITFSCGPATITVTTQKNILKNTTIDGGNKITLSGGGTTGIFDVAAGTGLSISNLTLSNGNVRNMYT